MSFRPHSELRHLSARWPEAVTDYLSVVQQFCRTPGGQDWIGSNTQASSIEITDGNPFVRDLPLFGQAGGYTFTAAGRHQIWAELDVTSRKLLRSNICEVNVLSLFRPLPKWAEIASLGYARTLFYRTAEFAEFSAILRLVRSAPKERQAMIMYICAKAALSADYRDRRRTAWVRDLLQRCLDLAVLPPHQQLRAEQALTLTFESRR